MESEGSSPHSQDPATFPYPAVRTLHIKINELQTVRHKCVTHDPAFVHCSYITMG